jgi:hypothetical protein
MPKRKKKQVKKSWLDKTLSYQIFSNPIGVWLFFLSFILCFAGLFYLFILQEFENPPTSETFVAEVSKLWYIQLEDETGGQVVYRVNLRRDEDEFTCIVPQLLKKIWYALEQEKSYEFEVSRTRTRCYINKATEIETEEGLFGVEGK